ncbi:MAG: amino acid ABC transporter substrate-binding protein, partial [Desulforhopalus sp.]|nr:amino acid ABC transporter substrate-binding protein [Desulforhopalus sp.]
MRSEFYAEYFLEGFDMMTDQDYAIAVYPRLTFGSGQRYASKGCYIVKLTQGPNPEMVPVNDWITY